jgi:Putative Ig domain
MLTAVESHVMGSLALRASWLRAAVLATVAVALAACGGGGSDGGYGEPTGGSPPSSNPPSGSPAANPAANKAPTISGAPAISVAPGAQYSFVPSAKDENGDPLIFSITNRPPWTAFDSSNGTLSGTPTMADVGTYSSIRISVTDGAATASLPTFNIQVMNTGVTGIATLSWTPPSRNTDGSTYTNPGGYKIYWGVNQGAYTNSAQIGTGLTTYVIDQLTPGTWYFSMTAFNSQGVESALTGGVSKTIQ